MVGLEARGMEGEEERAHPIPVIESFEGTYALSPIETHAAR